MLNFRIMYAARGLSASKRKDTGKWRRAPHPGIDTVARLEYQGWQIQIAQRQVGLTTKRSTMSATLRQTELGLREFLSGYKNKQAAINAAKGYVDRWHERERGSLYRLDVRRRKWVRRNRTYLKAKSTSRDS